MYNIEKSEDGNSWYVCEGPLDYEVAVALLNQNPLASPLDAQDTYVVNSDTGTSYRRIVLIND